MSLIWTRRPKGAYLTDVLTDEAIGFLERRDSNRPFFFVCWTLLDPHADTTAKGLVEKYVEKRQNFWYDGLDRSHAPNQSVSRGRQDDPAYAAMMELG